MPLEGTVAVTLNHRTPRETARAVESLRQGSPSLAGIIVVDNASGDDSVSLLRDLPGRAPHRRRPERRIFSRVQSRHSRGAAARRRTRVPAQQRRPGVTRDGGAARRGALGGCTARHRRPDHPRGLAARLGAVARHSLQPHDRSHASSGPWRAACRRTARRVAS